MSANGAFLSVNNIEVIYDHVILVLKGVSLEVPEAGVVALLGANGAGKTTTLKAISNLLRAERGEVTKGTIEFEGQQVDKLTPSDLVKRGVVQVMEGRHCFEHLTIEENLLTGAYTQGGKRAQIQQDLEKVYGYFPRLKERRRSQAGYTSGGEQQMCAIGRALMSRPRMILLDEPSMGLAPQLVETIFETVKRLNEQEGVSFLLAE
jgi:branched-chain amino acid transport system ATP-binding protein